MSTPDLLPDGDAYSDDAIARVVPCPPKHARGCGAPLGQPCRTAAGAVRREIHVAREEAWSVHVARERHPDHSLNRQENQP